MLQHYRMFAAYNAWANAMVFDASARISDGERKRDLGAFFRSIHGTLNHLLYADRVWMTRFSGGMTGPVKLDTVLHDDFAQLHEDRIAEDNKIISLVDGLDATQLEGTFSYQRGNPPQDYTDRFAITLAHFFNHQTHHRGQVHAMLTMLDQPSLELDLIFFLRSETGSAFASL